MNDAGAAAVVAILSLLWSFLLFWLVFRRQNAPFVPTKGHPSAPPLRVALFSGVWSLGVVVWILVWRSYSSKTGALSIGTSNWFGAGWSTGLEFFGIAIDKWYTYLLIVLFQITRSVLSSLLGTVFSPYLVAVQSRSKPVHPDHMGWVKLAQLCKDCFGWVTSITDIFLYLSQLDVALVSLLIVACFDWASTDSLMLSNIPEIIDFPKEGTRPHGLRFDGGGELSLDE